MTLWGVKCVLLSSAVWLLSFDCLLWVWRKLYLVIHLWLHFFSFTEHWHQEMNFIPKHQVRKASIIIVWLHTITVQFTKLQYHYWLKFRNLLLLFACFHICILLILITLVCSCLCKYYRIFSSLPWQEFLFILSYTNIHIPAKIHETKLELPPAAHLHFIYS